MVLALPLIGVAYFVFADDNSSGDNDGGSASDSAAVLPSATRVLATQTPIASATRPSGTTTTSPVAGSVTTTPAVTGTTTPAGTTTPGIATTPGTPNPNATGTPAIARLPDRSDCAGIRGSDYRSDTERSWYLANCQVVEAPLATQPSSTQPSSAGTTTSATTTAPFVPFVPPPPDNPYVAAYQGLVQDYVGRVNALGSNLTAPQLVNDDWVLATRNAAARLRSLNEVTRSLQPEPCLTQVHANLRGSTIEFDLAADLTDSALNSRDSNLLRLAQQRLSNGVAQLGQTTTLLANASC